MKTSIRALGVAATVGMFLVLVMGSAVTNTGSEHGCGRSWPLCHGQLIPQFAVSTAIEFSHRAVVGVETTLILAFAAGALYLYRRRDIRVLVALMVAFLFLQAGLGAWAVMYPQFAPVLALHFGVSLVAFASVLLTTTVLFEVDGADRLRDISVPLRYRRLVWGLALYSYVVIYLGALVRHTDADDACAGWPLCNGAVIPELSRLVLTAFVHRVSAFLLVAGIAWLAVLGYRMRTSRPDLFLAGLLTLALVVLQAISGALVVFTHLDLFSALAHAALVGLMFGCLTYLCVHVLRVPQGTTPTADRVPEPEADGVPALASGLQQ